MQDTQYTVKKMKHKLQTGRKYLQILHLTNPCIKIIELAKKFAWVFSWPIQYIITHKTLSKTDHKIHFENRQKAGRDVSPKGT